MPARGGDEPLLYERIFTIKKSKTGFPFMVRYLTTNGKKGIHDGVRSS